MKSFTAVVEKCSDTGLYVGYVPGFAGAHSQGDSLDELKRNLEEVVAMLLEYSVIKEECVTLALRPQRVDEYVRSGIVLRDIAELIENRDECPF